MADIRTVESEKRRKSEFYSALEQYYRRKWNATLRIPYISGRPVDFYLLYQKVTALGGWVKVSNGNRWGDIVGCLNIPDDCVAAEQAVKSIYMRYLAKFEQAQLFGENDGDNADGSGSNLNGRSQRGRLYLSSLTGASPCSRYPSSNILDTTCSSSITGPQGSASVLEGPQCERLIRSLKSGLPNEVDFAINVCMILSNPTTKTTTTSSSNDVQASLQLNNTPVLVDLLLAHAGIFDDGFCSYRQLYKDGWSAYTPGRDFEKFWLRCCVHGGDGGGEEDDVVKTLLDTTSAQSSLSLSSDDSLFSSCLEVSPKEMEILKRRVEQVATILRNFSFEPDCRTALANSRSLLRYLLIATNSWSAELQSWALDTLSNVAVEVKLGDIDPLILRLLMKTLHRFLHSDDKLHVIRALETIGNLCRNELNEAILCEFLEPVVIRRMIALLAVKDIMMCVYLLECLYQMTEMGRVPCQRLAEQPNAIDTLVQLVTVEAVSFGPNGLLGMKVVEYGMPTPHTAILPDPSNLAPAFNLAPTSVTNELPPPISMDGRNRLAAHSPVDPSRAVQSAIAQQQQHPALPPPLPALPPPFLARPVRPMIVGDPLSPSNSVSAPRLFSSSAAAVATAGVVRQRQQSPSPVPPVKKQAASCTPLKSKERSNQTLVDTASSSSPSNQQPGPRHQHRGPAVTVQQDQHVEQLTMNWLRQNCCSDPSSRVSRGELYTGYVQEMRGLYDTMAVSVSVFTNYIRQMFPSCNVRQLDNAAINGGVGTGAAAAAQQPSSACRSTLLEFDGLKFVRRNAAASVVKNSLMSPCSSSCSSTSPPLSQVVAQHPLMQQILSSSSAAGNNTTEKQQSTSGTPRVGASPVSAAAVNATTTTTTAIRARSDSVGTLDDSMYSVPGTPDSLSSSGFSGTNSSGAGVYGATNFASVHQQQSCSPKSPTKNSKGHQGGKKKTSTTSNDGGDLQGHGTTATTTVPNEGGGNGLVIVNGTVSNSESTGSTTTESATCHLEICHPAQEARAVIETGDNHEAKIVRVENTVAMVSSQFYLPDNSNTNTATATATSAIPPSVTSEPKIVNGIAAKNGGDSSAFHSDDNSNGCGGGENDVLVQGSKMPSETTTSAPSVLSSTSTPAKKNHHKKKLSTSKGGGSGVTLPLNGLVKPLESSFEATYNSVISGDSSPGPDTEAMNLNVNQSIQGIQELLAGESSDADAAKPAPEKGGRLVDSTTTMPEKGANNKKGASLGKRKLSTIATTNATNDVSVVDGTPSTAAAAPPPKKKKKYYPKKKKTPAASPATPANSVISSTTTISPRQRSDDSFSRMSAGSPHSSNMSSTSAGCGASSVTTSFRLPLPPTGATNQAMPPHHHVVQQAVAAAAAANATNAGAGTQVIVRIPPPSSAQLKYMCEWDGCGRTFATANGVYYHVSKEHVDDETRFCRWPHCDQTARLRWSLVAHVQDIHCNEHALRTAAIRRYELSVCGFSNIPEPRAPPPHPGYPPDAAVVAIKRHAFVNLAKDIVDETEGPVTKSIRLTSSLILRNLARYSTDGRRLLRKYEHLLAYLSFSHLESSITLAQCLADLNCSPRS